MNDQEKEAADKAEKLKQLKASIYQKSREQFNSYAALDAPHLPPEHLSALQVRLTRWCNTQFGPQHSTIFALGICEEIGEFAEATERHDIIDAVGDVLVWATQLATNCRLDFGVLLNYGYSPDAEPLKGLIIAQARIAHVAIKEEQRIRGYDDSERVRTEVAENLVRLISNLRAVCNATLVLEQAYIDTAEHVLKRNWKADPVSAGELASAAIDTMLKGSQNDNA